MLRTVPHVVPKDLAPRHVPHHREEMTARRMCSSFQWVDPTPFPTPCSVFCSIDARESPPSFPSSVMRSPYPNHHKLFRPFFLLNFSQRCLSLFRQIYLPYLRLTRLPPPPFLAPCHGDSKSVMGKLFESSSHPSFYKFQFRDSWFRPKSN